MRAACGVFLLLWPGLLAAAPVEEPGPAGPRPGLLRPGILDEAERAAALTRAGLGDTAFSGAAVRRGLPGAVFAAESDRASSSGLSPAGPPGVMAAEDKAGTAVLEFKLGGGGKGGKASPAVSAGMGALAGALIGFLLGGPVGAAVGMLVGLFAGALWANR